MGYGLIYTTLLLFSSYTGQSKFFERLSQWWFLPLLFVLLIFFFSSLEKFLIKKRGKSVWREVVWGALLMILMGGTLWIKVNYE